MLIPYGEVQPTIDGSVFVAETAVVVGDVTIGCQSSIWYGCVVRGDVNAIRIGRRSNIQDLSVLHVTHWSSPDQPGCPLIIGDDVTVGHGVVLHGCSIGNGALIGMRALVMDRVQVGEGALVAAGSLVSEGTIIPPRTLWIGSPARYRRDLTAEESARQLETAGNYVHYARQYLYHRT